MARRIRTLALVAGGAVALGGAGWAAVGFGGADPAAPERSSLPPATATVERTTLVETEEVEGTLGYGAARTLSAARGGSSGQGLLTWLAGEGSTVSRGETVYKVDAVPVPLLYGKLPVYRTMRSGVEGSDVLQLERNLRALGYTGFTVDKTFSSATAEAVRQWQEDLGVTETGRIEPGSVVIASGRIRITDHKKAVGDPASGALLTYTGTTRMVTIDLDVDLQNLAEKGAKVTVEIPGGDSVEGRIAKVGSVATQQGGEAEEAEAASTIEVVVSLSDDRGLGRLDQAPVDVRLTADRERDVLAVPVAALLALPDGGYGVQVVEGSTTRTVAVEVGMFADGMVEVEGTGLGEGMKVGIPK
ncbi:Multidrug efflux pump subunit AcrA (membrane-fusion protein) [Thermomonospora echinospora]|uniref:Multidrug efflux pump subunit AcrA (Membrane-fusion protein) n=1 Tax=Thermomonospora echinospora TaxID=1992 RepID=A0A1H5WXD7_9ACTN|nr:peptidoglycan-binding protein [Thermomonospora echinospora]SEG04289.1 Multidrug efflux pump subunit AcrA (membrane-fusion protein) [Thermomonospora echinospora]